MPVERFVDGMFASTGVSYGFSKEDAIALLQGIEPAAALAEMGVTRDKLSLGGAEYFDKVIVHLRKVLNAGVPVPPAVAVQPVEPVPPAPAEDAVRPSPVPPGPSDAP
jgi:hypothetical protein